MSMRTRALFHGGRACRDVTVVPNPKEQSTTLRPQFRRAGSGAWQAQKKL